MNRKVGRPSGKTEARDELIEQARTLFSALPYEKVSTRMIAESAQVNAAMIRYYFGSKEGLFEEMIRETMSPMRIHFRKMNESSTGHELREIMATHARQMAKFPNFPRLVFQSMSMPESAKPRQLLQKVFDEYMVLTEEKVFEQLLRRKLFRDDVDPELCRLSMMSLMMFPLIAPPAILEMNELTMNEEFIERLLAHNFAILENGMFKTLPSNTVKDTQ
jgi:AcrR family transcriptional regulator